MAHLNIYLDDKTSDLIKQSAKKNKVSISHYINNLIQRALMLEENIDDFESFVKQPKLQMIYKKMMIWNLENLALTQYLVKHVGDEGFEKANREILEKARAHAEGYVAGLLEE